LLAVFFLGDNEEQAKILNKLWSVLIFLFFLDYWACLKSNCLKKESLLSQVFKSCCFLPFSDLTEIISQFTSQKTLFLISHMWVNDGIHFCKSCLPFDQMIFCTTCRYLLLGQERRSCRLSLLVYNKGMKRDPKLRVLKLFLAILEWNWNWFLLSVLEASLRNCRDKRWKMFRCAVMLHGFMNLLSSHSCAYILLHLFYRILYLWVCLAHLFIMHVICCCYWKVCQFRWPTTIRFSSWLFRFLLPQFLKWIVCWIVSRQF